MKKNELTDYERQTLAELKTILDKHDVKRTAYSLGRHSEDCVCIEKRDNIWMVYKACDGQVMDFQTCLDVNSAVYSFLGRKSIGSCFEDRDSMKTDFVQYLKNCENEAETEKN